MSASGIRSSVPRTVLQSLVSRLVQLRLDYCNAVLAGMSMSMSMSIPLHLARRLQSVMNAAAWLVFASSKCDHITPLLRQLHRLKVAWRIDYKLAVLVCKCLHDLAPSIRHTSLTNLSSSRVGVLKASVCVRLRLMNCLFPVPDS